MTDAKADYIKTSTGFGSAGAQLEDIELFREHIGSDVKIKAQGEYAPKRRWKHFAKQAAAVSDAVQP